MLVLMIYCVAISTAAVTYKVGDEEGWDPVVSMESWTKGKTFFAGDVLEFIYDDPYDVAVVNKTAHDDCSLNDASIVLERTGDNKYTLPFGANYFIDSHPDICALGLKMAIDAKAPPT
ncbi:Plastocyanin-like protein [Corchorus olitorius]|uniref:Plastocyanin-like protein n=1 Tax=Corchorus olitorius TaxID=93759 RepID=A0A1R3JB86_9ROSI|nr:Plastocyanin-like protein [Corchorus olitorius]